MPALRDLPPRQRVQVIKQMLMDSHPSSPRHAQLVAWMRNAGEEQAEDDNYQQSFRLGPGKPGGVLSRTYQGRPASVVRASNPAQYVNASQSPRARPTSAALVRCQPTKPALVPSADVPPVPGRPALAARASHPAQYVNASQSPRARPTSAALVRCQPTKPALVPSADVPPVPGRPALAARASHPAQYVNAGQSPRAASVPPYQMTVAPPVHHHIDHALEMWREGWAMGDGSRGRANLLTGYCFDGKVDEVGAGDDKPASEAEIEEAHYLIKTHLHTRFATLHKAFLLLDEDRSNQLTVLEFARVLMVLNLPQIREKVLARIAHLADIDEDGMVEFDEFARLMSCDHANDLLKLHRTKPAKPRPRTPRRPTTPRRTGRVPGYRKPPTRVAPPMAAKAPSPRREGAMNMQEMEADYYRKHQAKAGKQPPNGIGIDHALEMFREGVAMGDGSRGRDNLLTGYRFDGKVDEVSERDGDVEITTTELEQAHDIIRSHLSTRFATFRRAFLMMDEDRSGKVTTLEFMRALMMLHLTNVREKVLKRLVFIADSDEDGYVEFHEFCDLMMAEDALPMLKRHEKR